MTHSFESYPVATEPEIALAMLRRNVESRLTRLRDLILREKGEVSKPSGIDARRALKELRAKGVITDDMESAIRGVMEAANPAIHGQKVQPARAGWAIEVGQSVIELLDRLVAEAESIRGT